MEEERAFFIEQRGNIEARYTTNKEILSEIPIQEMHDTFQRSEAHLNLETTKTDPIIEQKLKVQNIIQTATLKQLGQVPETLCSIGKTVQVNA